MHLISEAVSGLSGRDLTSPPSDEQPTITVIGAGNCQDIDLISLATSFREIRLIDIDAVAVQNAVSRLPPFIISRTRVFAPIDIAAPLMSRPDLKQSDTSLRSAFLAELKSSSLQDDVPVSDVVVSTCVLSQLIDSASQIFPHESPDFLPLIQAVRRGHLVRILNLTAAAGRALLITDLVSSDTVPVLAKTPSEDLPKLMYQCLQSGNFFSGLNPAVVQHDLQHVPACVQLCSQSRILSPWHWQLGPRNYAVYAIEMVRSGFEPRQEK